MQLYVYFGGQNHGPYSIDQIRQYVQAGNFKDDHLACYDGKNWVKIKDVYGFVLEVKKSNLSSKQSPVKKEPMRKKDAGKKLLIVSMSVILALLVVGGSVAGVGYYLLGDDEQPVSVGKEDIFTLTPDQVVEVYDGDTFKINLPSEHPLFGDNLAIRIFGIDTPELKGSSDEVKHWRTKQRTARRSCCRKLKRLN